MDGRRLFKKKINLVSSIGNLHGTVCLNEKGDDHLFHLVHVYKIANFLG
jgi:hypothetical protein